MNINSSVSDSLKMSGSFPFPVYEGSLGKNRGITVVCTCHGVAVSFSLGI